MRWVSVQTVRFPPRNSKWTAVSDVGATEVRKYFSTFVTRPVYWFRQIVPERGSEIRDAHAKSRSTTKQRYKGMCKGKREREREKQGERVVAVSECIDAVCPPVDCDRRDDGLS